MLKESHSSHNSSGRNEERHGAKAGNRQPGSDREAMEDGIVVVVCFDAAEEKVGMGDTLDGSEGGGAGVWTETASCTHERGAADAPSRYAQLICVQTSIKKRKNKNQGIW
jgi:hypothetical protein